MQKSVLIHLAVGGPSIRVALYEGVESVALSRAVAARAGFSSDTRFYLTAASRDHDAHEQDAEGVGSSLIVPLSSALPDGLELLLHRCQRRSISRESLMGNKAAPAAAELAESARLEFAGVAYSSSVSHGSSGRRRISSAGGERDEFQKAGVVSAVGEAPPSSCRDSRSSPETLVLPLPSRSVQQQQQQQQQQHARSPAPRRLSEQRSQNVTKDSAETHPMSPQKQQPPPDNSMRGGCKDLVRPLLTADAKQPLFAGLGRSQSESEDALCNGRKHGFTRRASIASSMGSTGREGWFAGCFRWKGKQRYVGDLRSVGSWTSFQASQSETDDFHQVGTPKEDHLNCAVDAVERFSRLSTDLANERTLLAWIRTCLAAIRTAFTYLSLTWATRSWRWSVILCEVIVALLAVTLAATGWKRYSSIKNVLQRKVPPHGFGRISVKYINLLVFVATIITAVSISLQEWKHD